MRSAGGAGDGRPVMSRRGLLKAGALVAVAGPVLAACTGKPAPSAPDALQPMLDLATKDATTAKAAAAKFADNAATLTVISTVRQQHAAALRAEVNRAAAVTATPPASSTSAAPKLPAESTVNQALLVDLTTAQHQAAAVLPKLPRYRAGLVGSIAAGCASLTEALNSTPITPTSATSANPAPSGGSPTLNGSTSGSSSALPSSIPSTSAAANPLADDTAQALQSALAAANAALWLYGTASAFVGSSVENEIDAAMGAVQNLRDAAAQRLAAGQVTPQPAQPAYLVPKPMANQATALVDLAIAEAGSAVAWRTVLEHTDDGALRSAALAALVDSAVRQTRWRRLAKQSPASVAMPGVSAAA